MNDPHSQPETTGPVSQLRIELGRRLMDLQDWSQLGPGSVIDLDCGCDEDLNAYVDGRLIARGEAVVVDGRFGFRVKEVAATAGTATQ